ncbi:hypothetical protein RsTz2092_02930 [Deferribacterales bacterium RsTz2092]|nr:hypothetical protein AGMMS49941_06670 [Deferribacterales bacterium]
MRLVIALALCFIGAVNCIAADVKRPSQVHKVYFEGTDYELHVYSIYGRRLGKTMLILGGIQGDEPGGFLSADSYINFKLEQGNLILMPRTNLKSIMLNNRGPDGDMNRLFTDDIKATDRTDVKVVQVIIEYMSKADIFLNLHDGWGFHTSSYVNEQRNPNKFGQSVIVDDDKYICKDGKVLDLKSMAMRALEGANARIENKSHMLAYFNTMTNDPKTKFKEMQKTATWYALRNYCIPAFGIETAKDITSNELKVLYHNYVIGEFMKIMDIIPENPPIYVPSAKLEQVLVTVNGSSKYLKNNEKLQLKKGDKVSIKGIESNYTTGITCDILGLGNLNDQGKELTVDYSTKVVFRKDNVKFAEVSLDVVAGAAQPAAVASVVNQPVKESGSTPKQQLGYMFSVVLNGKRQSIAPERIIRVKDGDTLTLEDIQKDGKSLNVPVNLRGWVASYVRENTGDDRKHRIIIAKRSMLSRFSVDNKGAKYPVTVDIDGQEVARFYIELAQ